MLQYDDNVVGPGSPKYDDAYFEINYVRAYTTGGPAPTASASTVPVELRGSSTAVRDPAVTGVFSGRVDSTSSDGDMITFGLLPLLENSFRCVIS